MKCHDSRHKLPHFALSTLSFTAATGLLTGTCVDVTRGVNLSFGGALLQKQGLVTGRYLAGARTGLMMMQAR
jgi:hypothetical protein